MFQAIFHDCFWKSDHDFLIAFHGNFLSGMHGFRGFYCTSGNDVMVIYPLGGISHRFCWRNMKERPWFHNHGSLTYVAYLLPFRSYSTFIMAGNCPFCTILGVFLGKTPPTFITTHLSSPNKCFLTRLFELLFAKIGSRVWALLKNIKKLTGPVFVAPTWRLDRSSHPNKIWQGW